MMDEGVGVKEEGRGGGSELGSGSGSISGSATL